MITIENLRTLLPIIKSVLFAQFSERASPAVARSGCDAQLSRLAYQITSFYDDNGVHKVQIVVERQPLKANAKEEFKFYGFQTIPTKSSGDDSVPKPSLLKGVSL